jgi:hypothetical protein
MSELLDPAARLDPQRSRDLDATDAAMGVAVMRAFIVRIGPRGAPRLEFSTIAESSARATEEHLHKCRPGERLEVIGGK